MAIFKQDTFTEATPPVVLTSHTSNTGSGWAAGDSADFTIVASGQLQANSGHRGIALGNENPSASSYWVQCVGRTGSTEASNNFGVVARSGSSAYYIATCYVAFIDGQGNWTLERLNGGVSTHLQSSFTQGNPIAGFAPGTNYTLRMTITGSNPVNIVVSINGSNVTASGGYNDSSVDRVTAAGNVGLYYRGPGVSNAVIVSMTADNSTSASNNPPVVSTPIPDQGHSEGAVVSLNLSSYFSDPDPGDSLSYSITSGSLPTGLSLNSSTGVVSGTIQVGAATGSPYNITFRATDTAAAFVQDSIVWTVSTQSSPTISLLQSNNRHLVDAAGSPRASLTGIRYAVFNGHDVSTFTSPISGATGTNGATNASGEMTLTLSPASVSSGQNVTVLLRSSDGAYIGTCNVTVD